MARDFFNPNNVVSSARNLGSRGLQSGLNTFGGFRKFLLRGSVVELAVGVVIGAAFNTVVQGMVTDLIQPLLGKVGNIESLDTWMVDVFLIGHFIGLIISFLITAAIVYFLIVLPVNSLRDRFENLMGREEEVTTRDCPFCLTAIPVKATRCAACTSNLPDPQVEPAQV